MRRLRYVLMVVLLLLAVAQPASAASPGDLVGVWTSTDAVDDSNQVMLVGLFLRVTLIDDNATGACDPDAPAVARGRGAITGDTFDVDFIVKCLSPQPAFAVGVGFELQDDGTLIDGTGTVWTRVFP